MTSVGIDQNTGQLLVGWPHTAQSITKCVLTEIGSRVERRDFGSRIPSLQDRPQNEETMLDFFIAIAEALEPRRVRNSIYGEPRFDLKAIDIKADVAGNVALSLMGDYYPDGHRQDPAARQQVRLVIPVEATALN